MGLLSALCKGALRSLNDKHAESQREDAKDVAYQKAGKRLKKAKKTGKYISGKKAYQEELEKEHKRIDTKHERRNSMINDL